MARQSYAQVVIDVKDDEDVIVYETSSSRRSGHVTKAPAHDSDFENEGSEHESEVEIEEEAELEESEPESDEGTDEGYDSGVKLKGRNTSKKVNSTDQVHSFHSPGQEQDWKTNRQDNSDRNAQASRSTGGRAEGIGHWIASTCLDRRHFRRHHSQGSRIGLERGTPENENAALACRNHVLGH
jgi:hypothetical protein